MPYIRILDSGKSQVIKDVAFVALLSNMLPDSDKSIIELISEFDNAIYLRDSSVTKDALNNVHGDWYEWLLAIAAWNFCADNPTSHLAIPTPNISQFTIAKLYNERLYNLFADL